MKVRLAALAVLRAGVKTAGLAISGMAIEDNTLKSR